HKSSVDYDVTMQLLNYMVGIWREYRNEKNDEYQRKISATKGFRYPLIIPIVYYEGKRSWTAAMHLNERVELSEAFPEYVPDFTYRVISLNEYSREEILSQEDEFSLVMLFNRIQTLKDMDINRWSEEEREIAQKILTKAPDTVVDLLAQMIHHFGHKINAPDETINACVNNVKERDMGELWANMDKIDIQAEWRKAKKVRKELREEKHILQEEKQNLQEEKQNLQEEKQNLQEEKQNLQEEKQNLQEEKQNLQEKEHELEEKAQELQEKEHELGEVKQELGDALKTIAALEAKIKEFEHRS
ncbi:MAG: Rpn family recombination-promoting nuclease/putative transposase, partial [Muribaculum sp.]|nr:Rpn family recombination-promoting nuclease/putative transposase [Muribaculum sp.]